MILLETDEWERFRNLDPGSQESWLQKFWRTHEGSAGPYLQEKFHKRVALADQLFRSSDRGALTDQGRVFVRFGEPDDITKELNPQEEDWIYNYLNRAISQDEADYVGGRPKRNPNDHSSYIVWDYINRGDPILPHWGTTSGGHSLKFIFLDDHGTGYYRLIYSTLFGGF